jgi:hypothetical protein
MKIILESRLILDPKTNTEKYVDGYFLTVDQLVNFMGYLPDTYMTNSDEDKNCIYRWIKKYNDKSK